MSVLPAGHPSARGRHASARGDGFTRLVGLTTIGALLPGSGLLAAGRRTSGLLVLSAVVFVLGTAATLVANGGALPLLLRLAVRPDALLAVAGVAVVGGLAWVAVIVATHVALRPRRMPRWQSVLAALLVAALVTLVLVPTGLAVQYSLAQRNLLETVFADEPAVPGEAGAVVGPQVDEPDPWARLPRINVLLLGSDAGLDRIGTRPDTLIVASIDTRTGDTLLISLPRNLENVPFPPGTPGDRAWPDGFDCGDECLLNAVWSWAEANPQLFPGDDSPGLTATSDAVSAALGLQIHRYALVNLQGFEDLVNAMGGLVLDVPRRLPIGGGTNQATGGKYPITGYIEPGVQRLDGYHALWVARSREGSDDYDRMRRQRCVIGAAIDQADPRRMALAFPRLAAAASANVLTDIRQNELDAWVELALRIKDASVLSLPLTDDLITPARPDYEGIRDLVREALNPPPPAPAPSATATDDVTGETTAPAPGASPAEDIATVC